MPVPSDTLNCRHLDIISFMIRDRNCSGDGTPLVGLMQGLCI